MRVISGSAGHIPLKTIPGDSTRPTTDKIKETLFNMLQFDIPGCTFLDLFAGSGAIGIEALSRGAINATFVDNNPKAIACVNDNLNKTRLLNKAEVIKGDCIRVLGNLAISAKKPYNIVFADPPYDLEIYTKILITILNSKLIDDNTLIILEMRIDNQSIDYTQLGYNLIKEKLYKTNKHVFLRRT